ncbi:S66 family peptidase [Brevibacillus sp. SYSU BS000544]|uniref:S66 family peptidase n=1 Tax=Brevibacillus sp. SYSU BS000544 TaxID=3416443 RepID=UPI003CE4D46A
MYPSKLREGDEVRVISPSTSLSALAPDQRAIAVERLASAGLRVSFSEHAEECDRFQSSSIESRVADLHEAFRDNNVKAILTTLGGHNCNQLLRYLDYDLIKQNPKILCGYSDITALQNAIYAKTGLVTYSGPHFSTFGILKGNEYTRDHFEKCLMQDDPIEVLASPEWSDDRWYLDQQNRIFIPNDGPFVINEGEATGTLIGGNLCTINLLQGTEYMPDLRDSILFVEDDNVVDAKTFDRDLQSLIHQPGFDGVKGIVIGRFQKESRISKEDQIAIVSSKKELSKLPVVADVNFGHTSPIITFPVGGVVRIRARDGESQIIIEKH